MKTRAKYSRAFRLCHAVLIFGALLPFAAAAQFSSLAARNPTTPPGAEQSTPRSTPQTLDIPEALSLNRCYELALAMSEDDRIRASELAIAQARYRQAVGGLLPEIGLFLDKTYDDRRDENRVGQTNDGLTQGGQFIQENPLRTGVNVRLPLFAGFRSYPAARAGQYDQQRLRLERRRFRELLYQDVADVYYQVLQYETADEILRDQHKALSARIAELRRRVNIGRSRRGELLAARSDSADNVVELEENRALLQASKELLAFLTGLPANLLQLAKPRDLPGVEQLEAYLQTTGERKDLLAAAQSVRADRELLKSARGDHLPEVTIEGNYFYSQEPDLGRDWNIVLRIELPLFQGGTVQARVDESEARMQGSRLELQRLRRSADFETRMSYNDFVSAAARVVLLRESLRLAGETYRIQLRDYRLGIVTNLEVLDALRRFHLSRLNLARTELLAFTNQVRLHVAAGRLDPEARADDDEAPQQSVGQQTTTSGDSAR
ncbi:MAG: TolC family protein [Leptospirales bacterium]